MMSVDRTRTFEATYTSSDSAKHQLKVRVFKRLAAFGLSLYLIKSAHPFVLKTDAADAPVNPKGAREEKDPNIELIEGIIKNNPNLLSVPEIELYTVIMGDTVEKIAKAFKTSVKRICELNGLKKDQDLYGGQILRVESNNPKIGLDKEVSLLESYFYDYLFQSEVASIAKSTKKEGALFKSMLYGNPKSEAEIDSSSIFGKYVTNYIDFHGKEDTDDKTKKKYIDELMNLESEAVQKLNLNGQTDLVVPYSIYNAYITNGTTNLDVAHNLNV